MRVCYAIAFWLVCFVTPDLFAQKITVEEYINTYKYLAISEMERSGIPASITLAQGILESANGNSRLAVVANNHFGIKCHDWKGKEIYHDDNEKGECFRHYKTAKESYLDHTDFLMNRSRYAFLFGYKSTDYKNWAKGLRKAGYATDPKYPQRLIDLIERYNLQQYDTGVKPTRKTAAKTPPATTNSKGKTSKSDARDDFSSFNIERYPAKVNNGTDYITAREGDTYTSLSNELDLMPWQLPKYNEALATDELHEGQVVYLQPKRRKAERGKDTHKVAEGETMYFISQKYAVKLSRLYTLNRMEEGTQPEAGDVLNLRRKKRK
ncbi:MAG: glucosaminidase domain-containing protein [Bacteroidales bacterium]|jgi:LysM repeat protein|nr:glucosaminidase domain-containing protein [Bacteroidales bacterium]